MARSVTAFFVLCAILLVGFVVEGGRMPVLVHRTVPMVVMISLSTGLAAFFLFPKEVRRRALKDLEEGAHTSPTSVEVWRFMERASYGSGLLALLLGLVITSSFLDMPLEVVGGKAGACLVMLAYGVLQGLAMAMLRARVEAGLTLPAPAAGPKRPRARA